MPGRDRTDEFLATIKSRREKPQWIQQQSRNVNSTSAAHSQNIHKLAFDPEYREFMKVSQQCSHRIEESCEKLQQLTQLAKQKTIFDDGQLNQLITEIRADISDSKKQLDNLQTRFRPKQKHSESIMSTLQQRLVNVTSDFKSALETRSRSVQKQAARQELFARPAGSSGKLTTSSSTSHMSDPSTSGYMSQNGFTDHSSNTNGFDNGSVSLNIGGPGPSQSVQPYAPQMQAQLLVEDQSDLAERADKMHLIESTIVELGTVFNQLASMVQTQGETITRIDMNISETTDNVEAAHDALLRYFASINSNRWLMLKVFGVLFFFFVLFVMFAA